MKEMTSEEIIGMLTRQVSSYEDLIESMVRHIMALTQDNDAMQSVIDGFFDDIDIDDLIEFVELNRECFEHKANAFVIVGSLAWN